jgi:hypothetical protein
MALDSTKTSRWLSLALLALASTVAAPGCASEQDTQATAEGDEEAASVEDISASAATDVKRQSIGNCWLYATASWLEGLHKGATGQALNASESYLTYWHWFESIANGEVRTEIETGGSFETGVALIVRYGLMTEQEFIPEEANAEMSMRQSSALAAINRSIKEGALKDPAARRNRALVRKELDAAWGLSPAVASKLTKVFGEGVTRTVDRSFRSRKPGNGVLRAQDIQARLKDPQTGQFTTGTLADAIGTKQGEGWWTSRSGKFAWVRASYPWDAPGRRAFWKRVQRAIHDKQPVVMTWNVDFNALDASSRFSFTELQRRGPGRQGGHLTISHDYQADVPGLGLLKAGVEATAPQMSAALADGTKIEFIRVKNSWGGIRPDRWTSAAIPGFHDLELAYLDGPIKWCEMKDDGSQDMTKCTRDVSPLREVVLPAGY